MSAAREAFVLVGPTASGKSAVAQHIAEQRGYEILSADAMLVYRGMDIGTAKPTAAERARVTYHGIDCVAPGQRFSVWDYRACALAALDAAARRGRCVMMVGGSGLYVKSLTHGLDAAPADPAWRLHWEGIAARDGVEALVEALRRRAPDVLDRLADPRNPRRLIRALEAVESDGPMPHREWSGHSVSPLPALAYPADVLRKRIEARVALMYEQGLLNEVRGLLDEAGLSATARQAIGYAEALDCIEGHCTQDEAMAETVRRTWQLVRRQRTWFRHQLPVTWLTVEAGMTTGGMAAMVEEYWTKHGPTRIAD